jgi:hypothetical protein
MRSWQARIRKIHDRAPADHDVWLPNFAANHEERYGFRAWQEQPASRRPDLPRADLLTLDLPEGSRWRRG